MNQQLNKVAVPGLRWATGLVVLWESSREFLHTVHAIHNHSHSLTLISIRLILASSEIVAVMLFLVPRTRVVGSYALLIIFALAMGIHIAHGEWGILSLSVYAMAVLVSLANR
jgi:hypothetical protein